jgi:hypothetical protein
MLIWINEATGNTEIQKVWTQINEKFNDISSADENK